MINVIKRLAFYEESIFLLPATVTILIHVMLGYFLIAGVNFFDKREWQVIDEPKFVTAQLVSIENLEQEKTKKPENKKLPAVVPKVFEKKVTPISQTLPVIRKTPPKVLKKHSEDLAGSALADLMSLVALEEKTFQIEGQNEISISYASSIQRKVISYWSRPPSARNGMECIIAIQLIPTGEVVAANILKTSGDHAFDLSALNAVQKAGAFPELKNLSRNVFEKSFRRFRLLFRPEDLRY